MTVLIAGAGIGGLTLALSLQQIGVDALIVESVNELRPLGVGINVLPHAGRELTELGLEHALAHTAVPTAELAYFSKHGKPIWSEPRGVAAGYNWAQYSVHRGRLQMLLFEAALERLGPAAFRFGQHLSGWQETDNGVRITCRDRNRGDAECHHDGALLVAADGIHSAARAQFYPDEGAPRWDGAILWRGVTTTPAFLDGKTMAMVGHEHQKFVTYPITRPDVDGAPVLVNWIAELKFDADHQWRREDWNRAGSKEDFLPSFANWGFDWLDIPALVRGADAIYEYPMVDRDPLPRWTHGRVTLLGDAAHPMYPIGSNGASQAILDARVLTRELQTHGLQPQALQAYEAERRPATAQIVQANRRSGPDEILDLIENRAPDGFISVDDVASRDECEAIAAKYQKIAGFDKHTLNSRPSIVETRSSP